MFVQILSLKHLIIYLPNMVKSLKVCAQMKRKVYMSGIHDIQNYWGLIALPTKLLISSILLFQIIFFSQSNHKECNHTYLTQRLALVDRWFLTCQTV